MNASASTAKPLSEVIERDLRAVLSDKSAGVCVTSPECLKHSIMKSKFVKHYTEILLNGSREWLIARVPVDQIAGYAEFLASEYFDIAVDRIYAAAA